MPGIFLDDRNIAVNKNKKNLDFMKLIYLCGQTLNNVQYVRGWQVFWRKIKQRQHLKNLNRMRDQAMELSQETANGSIQVTEAEIGDNERQP